MEITTNHETNTTMSYPIRLDKLCEVQTEQIALLTKERDQLTAKVAEMRVLIAKMTGDEWYLSEVEHALSDQCGAGWLSPDERLKLEARCLVWSGVFQRYQSFLANGLDTVETRVVIKDYEYCSQAGLPEGWLSPEKKKVLVEALQKVIPYIDHSHYVEIAKQAMEETKQ